MSRDGDAEYPPRVTRDALRLVEAALAPAPAVQRHGHQQAGQRPGARERALCQQHSQHARMCDDAAIFELPDHFIHGMFVTQRAQRTVDGSGPWEVRVTHVT